MKYFFSFLIVFVYLSHFGVMADYPDVVKKEIMNVMDKACSGKNSCYYSAEELLNKSKPGNIIIYLSCYAEYAMTKKDTSGGYEKIGWCLNTAVNGYVQILRTYGKTKLADRYDKYIEDCESWGGYDSQFKCWRGYLRDARGRYSK